MPQVYPIGTTSNRASSNRLVGGGLNWLTGTGPGKLQSAALW